MKGLYITSLLTAFFLSSGCGHSGSGGCTDDAVAALKKQKNKTDLLITDKSLEVYAKVKGAKEPLKVENKRYPRDIETTYNLLRDAKGRVLYIAEMPFSETSDWFIAYKSYFDTTGTLYSFQRINNFLNNGCTRGAAMENMVKYYDASFKVQDSTYTLTDTYKKPLEKGACKFPYNFPYQVFRTLKEYKESRGIPLSN